MLLNNKDYSDLKYIRDWYARNHPLRSKIWVSWRQDFLYEWEPRPDPFDEDPSFKYFTIKESFTAIGSAMCVDRDSEWVAMWTRYHRPWYRTLFGWAW